MVRWKVLFIALGILIFAPSVYAEELNSSTEEINEQDFIKNAPIVEQPFSENILPPEVQQTELQHTEFQQENKPAVVEGEGLEFIVYNENDVQAFAIIAAHEQYNLRPVLARNQIQGIATVSQMSQTQSNIAMINAGYFDWHGYLFGLTKIDGLIVSNDYFNRSAIGIDSEGKVIFGRVRYEGKILYNGAEFFINGINTERGEDRIIVYNERFGAATGTNNFGVEIEVQGGIITNIFRGKGNNFILKNAQIISAHGAAAEFFANAQIGDSITITQEIISDDADFNSVPNILGAGPRLVANGQILVTAEAENFPADIKIGRAPRSAVGVTQYGDYIFAVVDGRQAHSQGCTLQEWANILLNKFGAVDAINLDGGGSTELIVKGQIVNSPSDGAERSVGSALAIVRRADAN